MGAGRPPRPACSWARAASAGRVPGRGGGGGGRSPLGGPEDPCGGSPADPDSDPPADASAGATARARGEAPGASTEPAGRPSPAANAASNRSNRAASASSEPSAATRVILTRATSRGMRGSGAWRMSSSASPTDSSARVVARSPSWSAQAWTRSTSPGGRCPAPPPMRNRKMSRSRARIASPSTRGVAAGVDGLGHRQQRRSHVGAGDGVHERIEGVGRRRPPLRRRPPGRARTGCRGPSRRRLGPRGGSRCRAGRARRRGSPRPRARTAPRPRAGGSRTSGCG